MDAPDSLLDDDAKARASALDTRRSFIVQAPAGSGKTELLIQRYLTLLAEVDEPEEVLAITFTRKAAAEMRLRVLTGLQRAARGETPAKPHERITAQAARAVLDRNKARCWEILTNPRRLRIQTLDSLNAAIARMQPLTTSASTFGSSIADEAALKALYRRAAAATLDWLDEPGALCDATREVLLHVDANTALYIAYLARMLETRDQWLPFVAVGAIDAETGALLRREFEAGLEAVVSAQLEALRATFDEALSRELIPLLAHAADNLAGTGTGAGMGSILRPEDLDAGLPAADPVCLPAWQAIGTILQTRQGAWRKTVNKNQGFPPGDKEAKQAMLELLSRLGDAEDLRRRLHAAGELPPCRYSDEQWSVLLALFRLLPLAVAELHRLFAVRGVTDYIETALTAGEALGSAERPGDIALLLDYQLRHILIDEMQDTSRAQYRMLEALTGGWQAGDGRTLFCVGDPMQSIYRFRNAEVAQFLLARAKGIAGIELQPLLLRRNFRSGERLVNWFNAHFPAVLPAANEPATGAVSYSASIAATDFEGGGVLEVHPLFGSDVTVEAGTALRIIEGILEGEDGGDVAVLVRSRTQLAALLARLRASAIPYQAIDIDRLTDLPEIIDVLAITRAVAHPGDRLAWLAVLRSPALGLDWTDLLALVGKDRHKTVPELLEDEDRLAALSAYGRGAVTRFRPVFQSMCAARRTEGLRDRVERVWLQLGGSAIARDPQAVENVYRYFDVLSRLEIAGTLEDVAELEAQLDLERVSSDADARLKVMTMHRAKGLQFDHVLLYGLGRVPRQGESPVLDWFDLPDEHGGEHKVISPVGPRAELERDPIHRFIRTRESLKDRHEQARLLYVACTRARRSLHLLGHTRLSADGESYRTPDGRSLLSLLWEAAEPAFAAAFERGVIPTEAAEQQEWLVPRLRRLDSAWQLPLATAVPGQPVSTADEAAEAVSYEWVGADARSAGTIVHRWLKLAAEGDIRLGPGSLADSRPVSERWLVAMGVGADKRPAILDRVDEALRGVLADEKGKWLLGGEGHAELALSAVIDGRMTNAVIDRVRIDAGTHWIVDYKTSTHEGGRLEYFLEEQLRRYRPQLEKYAVVYEAWSGERPRCALYFPLLQRFIAMPLAKHPAQH